jgi:hypothetical protein
VRAPARGRLTRPGFSGTRVRDRALSRQQGDQLELDAQLEVQVEHDKQADHHPDVDDQVDPAADSGPRRKVGRMGRNPDEVDPCCRRDQRQLRDEGRAPLFVPSVEHDASEQER